MERKQTDTYVNTNVHTYRNSFTLLEDNYFVQSYLQLKNDENNASQAFELEN